ncbi:MAG: thermonuclease family protein [Proteobacteria bacterium]|nr:thermonuclease family protein [Pseudomonadota bacterium]
MQQIRSLTMALVLLLLPALSDAEIFTGKVVGVSDGDTITVLRDGKPIKVHLHGVDCPEKTEPFGEKAKQFTSKMVFGKVVQLRVVAKDRDGRMVQVAVETERDPLTGWSHPSSLNESLVAAGLGRWYREHGPKDRWLETLEGQARRDKRGLWAEPNATTAPWKGRRARQQLPKSVSCSSSADCIVKACWCRWTILRRGSREAASCHADWLCRHAPPPKPEASCVAGSCVFSFPSGKRGGSCYPDGSCDKPCVCLSKKCRWGPHDMDE